MIQYLVCSFSRLLRHCRRFADPSPALRSTPPRRPNQARCRASRPRALLSRSATVSGRERRELDSAGTVLRRLHRKVSRVAFLLLSPHPHLPFSAPLSPQPAAHSLFSSWLGCPCVAVPASTAPPLSAEKGRPVLEVAASSSRVARGSSCKGGDASG